MSDTPRTFAMLERLKREHADSIDYMEEYWDLCCQLERELKQAHDRLTELERLIENADDYFGRST